MLEAPLREKGAMTLRETIPSLAKKRWKRRREGCCRVGENSRRNGGKQRW